MSQYTGISFVVPVDKSRKLCEPKNLVTKIFHLNSESKQNARSTEKLKLARQLQLFERYARKCSQTKTESIVNRGDWF